MADALHALGATELLRRYRAGTLSPVEVVQDVLERIERWEPLLHATWALDPGGALAMARDSEARWRRGEARPLDGLPVTLKDNIATRGLPVPLGSAATLATPAAADAPPAARLREAGAVFLCKTTMPDYGMLSSGLSSFHALARNPWKLELNPGGSSAGAGAAGAAGYGPLHLGTDIGGSIRLPAGWCGLVGLKPSLGRVPIQPAYAGRVAGPMTRSVEDAALMMSVLARPDARDATALPPADIDWQALDLEPRGLRLGLWLEPGWGLPLDPATADLVREAARRFEAAGAAVEPLRPFVTREMADGMDRFWRFRSWLELDALPPERANRVLPFIHAWAAGAQNASGEQIFRAQAQMQAIREATVAASAGFDFVLSPVSPVAGFPADWPGPTNDPASSLEHIAFTLPWNMSEQPAVSVCAGLHPTVGLPVGLQIAGRRFDDLGVLRMARLWEALRDPMPPWPEPPGGAAG